MEREDALDSWERADYAEWFSRELQRLQEGIDEHGGQGRITFSLWPEPAFVVSQLSQSAVDKGEGLDTPAYERRREQIGRGHSGR